MKQGKKSKLDLVLSLLENVSSARINAASVQYCIRIAVQSGSYIDQQFVDGNTLLHMAIMKLLNDEAALLLQAGAHTHIKNDAGMSPKDIAVGLGDQILIQEICRRDEYRVHVLNLPKVSKAEFKGPRGSFTTVSSDSDEDHDYSRSVVYPFVDLDNNNGCYGSGILFKHVIRPSCVLSLDDYTYGCKPVTRNSESVNHIAIYDNYFDWTDTEKCLHLKELYGVLKLEEANIIQEQEFFTERKVQAKIALEDIRLSLLEKEKDYCYSIWETVLEERVTRQGLQRLADDVNAIKSHVNKVSNELRWIGSGAIKSRRGYLMNFYKPVAVVLFGGVLLVMSPPLATSLHANVVGKIDKSSLVPSFLSKIRVRGDFSVEVNDDDGADANMENITKSDLDSVSVVSCQSQSSYYSSLTSTSKSKGSKSNKNSAAADPAAAAIPFEIYHSIPLIQMSCISVKEVLSTASTVRSDDKKRSITITYASPTLECSVDPTENAPTNPRTSQKPSKTASAAPSPAAASASPKATRPLAVNTTTAARSQKSNHSADAVKCDDSTPTSKQSSAPKPSEAPLSVQFYIREDPQRDVGSYTGGLLEEIVQCLGGRNMLDIRYEPSGRPIPLKFESKVVKPSRDMVSTAGSSSSSCPHRLSPTHTHTRHGSSTGQHTHASHHPGDRSNCANDETLPNPLNRPVDISVAVPTAVPHQSTSTASPFLSKQRQIDKDTQRISNHIGPSLTDRNSMLIDAENDFFTVEEFINTDLSSSPNPNQDSDSMFLITSDILPSSSTSSSFSSSASSALQKSMNTLESLVINRMSERNSERSSFTRSCGDVTEVRNSNNSVSINPKYLVSSWQPSDEGNEKNDEFINTRDVKTSEDIGGNVCGAACTAVVDSPNPNDLKSIGSHVSTPIYKDNFSKGQDGFIPLYRSPSTAIAIVFPEANSFDAEKLPFLPALYDKLENLRNQRNEVEDCLIDMFSAREYLIVRLHYLKSLRDLLDVSPLVATRRLRKVSRPNVVRATDMSPFIPSGAVSSDGVVGAKEKEEDLSSSTSSAVTTIQSTECSTVSATSASASGHSSSTLSRDLATSALSAKGEKDKCSDGMKPSSYPSVGSFGDQSASCFIHHLSTQSMKDRSSSSSSIFHSYQVSPSAPSSLSSSFSTGKSHNVGSLLTSLLDRDSGGRVSPSPDHTGNAGNTGIGKNGNKTTRPHSLSNSTMYLSGGYFENGNRNRVDSERSNDSDSTDVTTLSMRSSVSSQSFGNSMSFGNNHSNHSMGNINAILLSAAQDQNKPSRKKNRPMDSSATTLRGRKSNSTVNVTENKYNVYNDDIYPEHCKECSKRRNMGKRRKSDIDKHKSNYHQRPHTGFWHAQESPVELKRDKARVMFYLDEVWWCNQGHHQASQRLAETIKLRKNTWKKLKYLQTQLKVSNKIVKIPINSELYDVSL